jgi:hypothetical protein
LPLWLEAESCVLALALALALATEIEKEIRSFDDVQAVASLIEKNNNLGQIIITNWIRLPADDKYEQVAPAQ